MFRDSHDLHLNCLVQHVLLFPCSSGDRMDFLMLEKLLNIEFHTGNTEYSQFAKENFQLK